MKYISEETKKWERRIEMIDALKPAVMILTIGALIKLILM